MAEQVRYKTLIDLGFKRFEGNDTVWFNQYGYEWFWLELKLTKRIHVVWCPEDKELILRRTSRLRSYLTFDNNKHKTDAPERRGFIFFCILAMKC